MRRFVIIFVCFSLVQSRLSPIIKTENQLLLAFQLIGPFLQRIQTESTKLLLEVSDIRFYLSIRNLVFLLSLIVRHSSL